VTRSNETRTDRRTSAQAQLSLHHPNEALSSALTAYEQVREPAPTTKTSPKDLETFSAFVLTCKKAKFAVRDRDRERRQGGLRAEFEDTLERNKQRDLDEVSRFLQTGEMGQVEAYERNQEILLHFESKCGELRSVFALADPANHKPREIPDHLVDMVCGC
jgi:STIP1 family protein 1